MIPIDGVRALAACHGYEEVQFNETSRVIAFTNSDPNNKTRVNVYYTTGTVATCLHHPYSGKTQLFRREQTLESLGELFANPRQHTGSGYYKCGGPTLKWTRCVPTSANQQVECETPVVGCMCKPRRIFAQNNRPPRLQLSVSCLMNYDLLLGLPRESILTH
jgi:hypothetical protein